LTIAEQIVFPSIFISSFFSDLIISENGWFVKRLKNSGKIT